MIEFRYVAPEEFAPEGAALMAAHITRAIDARGACHLALSGGRAPWELFGVLARTDLDWAKVHVWQVDERVAPDRDVDRNSVGLKTSLLALAPILASNVHLMDVTAPDLGEAAAAYASDLSRLCDGTLDLVHLGLGADGHTASWPPGDPVVDIADRDVAISKLYSGFVRMTLTVPCINRARHRVFLITGGDKEHAIGELAATGDIPAARVSADGTDALIALPQPLQHEPD
ncbi:MAG TPA: 6-phosphogluconolactonase [Microthrixaceae bacterium]|nr:6-phosphogluconolactonase [Microthrixaceae bacterium]HNI34570.1 6-phosphogluconolactonase [Microthrixaceae bacterium]